MLRAETLPTQPSFSRTDDGRDFPPLTSALLAPHSSLATGCSRGLPHVTETKLVPVLSLSHSREHVEFGGVLAGSVLLGTGFPTHPCMACLVLVLKLHALEPWGPMEAGRAERSRPPGLGVPCFSAPCSLWLARTLFPRHGSHSRVSLGAGVRGPLSPRPQSGLGLGELLA